jgi:catechol 2,3-dioxygenase-like lactoylglutathione lyase family enzyme
MTIPARITVATIGVYDMPKMRSFYRGLGWQETKTSSDAFASFKLDGAILALFPFEALAKDGRIPPGNVGRDFRGVTLAINVDSAPLVDSTIGELREKGATITKEPHEEVWGGWSAYFTDPEANLWEVVWAPGTSFDDDGKFVWGD